MARDEKDYAAQRTLETYDKELEEARRRTRELSTLLDISMVLPATSDLDNLLDAIINKSVELFEAADAGVLFLYDPHEEALIARASIGYWQEPLSQVRLRPGEAIAGKVFQRGEALLCSHPDEIAEAMENVREGNRACLDEARGELTQPRSAVSVPLMSRDSVLGALVLVNLRRYAAFSASDARFLQAIANQIAIVVENALLYEELQRKETLRGELLAKAISAQEEERKRIARELHDQAIQSLSAVLVRLGAIEEGISRRPEETRDQVREVRDLMTAAIGEVRQVALDLRPSALDDLGLVPAPSRRSASRKPALPSAGTPAASSGGSRRRWRPPSSASFRRR